MKRRHLEQLIAEQARKLGRNWAFQRAGAEHDLYDLDGKRIVIPRHREIAQGTAEKILKDTEEKLGERWWRR